MILFFNFLLLLLFCCLFFALVAVHRYEDALGVETRFISVICYDDHYYDGGDAAASAADY